MNETIRILVVDDNVGSAKLLATLLGYMGPYVVEVAHDGPSVLEMIGSFQPDAVLLDISLPGMDGYEVGREIRRNPAYDNLPLVPHGGPGPAALIPATNPKLPKNQSAQLDGRYRRHRYRCFRRCCRTPS